MRETSKSQCGQQGRKTGGRTEGGPKSGSLPPAFPSPFLDLTDGRVCHSLHQRREVYSHQRTTEALDLGMSTMSGRNESLHTKVSDSCPSPLLVSKSDHVTLTFCRQEVRKILGNCPAPQEERLQILTLGGGGKGQQDKFFKHQ